MTDLEFLPDGSLLEASSSGLRRWNLETGSFETLREEEWGMGIVAASRDGRPVLSFGFDLESRRNDGLRIDDLESGSSHLVSSHGGSVFAATFDPTGEILIIRTV